MLTRGIINESSLGGTFVQKLREHWWPQYSSRKLFWFNTGYLRAEFGDCLINARHRRLGCRATETFDRKALNLAGFVEA